MLFGVFSELMFSCAAIALKYLVLIIFICCNAIHQVPERTHDDIVVSTVCGNVCTTNVCFCFVDYAMWQAILKFRKFAKITEFFSWFYIVALKKNVLLREKTKDAFLRPMFPHISDSIFCGYLTGISSVLSGSPISVTPAIF